MIAIFFFILIGNLVNGSGVVLIPRPLRNGGYRRVSAYVITVGGPYTGFRTWGPQLARLLLSERPHPLQETGFS